MLHQIGETLHERLSSCATRSLLLIVAPVLKHLVDSLSEEERNLCPSPSKQSENNLDNGKGQKHVWCTEKMSDKEWTATRRSIWYKSVACEILPALERDRWEILRSLLCRFL